MNEPRDDVALLVGERLTTLEVGQVLVDAGCSVVVADTVPRELGTALPAGAGWLGALDASTPAGSATVVESARALAGRLNVLVQHHPTVSRVVAADIDMDAWDRDLAQLTIAFRLAREFAALAEPGSAIVNLASIDVSQAYSTRATASMVSNGLVGLSRALAVEWARIPIRVNVVALGVVLTDEERAAIEAGEQTLDRIMLRAPSHRLGELREAAGLVGFLVGPGARFITGQTIWADGGWSALTQHAEGLKFP
jgi:NAD(P)-dependent dehydrogenase (short-subunit alcohol dehydrogenase family)